MASAFLYGQALRQLHMAGSCPCTARVRTMNTTLQIRTRCKSGQDAAILSILLTVGPTRQTEEEGAAEPPDVMEGAAHYCHGNPASVIFDSDQLQLSDETPACLCCALWVFPSWGGNPEQTVVVELL